MKEVGDKVLMKAYKEAVFVDGTIDGIEFTGHDELDLTNLMDPATGDYFAFGIVTFYIEWNGLSGTFSGYVFARGTVLVDLEGIFVMQGAGDFEGMKLYGKLWAIDAYWGINGLSGTILVPN
jgi:hypothetical protein